MTTQLERIHLADIWPSSVEPIQLLGAFDADGGLFMARAPDLGRDWVRYPGESPDPFARRVCNDILADRGRPPLPGRAAMEDRAGAAPVDDRGRHPPRHDDATPNRSRPEQSRSDRSTNASSPPRRAGDRKPLALFLLDFWSLISARGRADLEPWRPVASSGGAWKLERGFRTTMPARFENTLKTIDCEFWKAHSARRRSVGLRASNAASPRSSARRRPTDGAARFRLARSDRKSDLDFTNRHKLLIYKQSATDALQGHGWGYRYLHGLIGNLALLAGFGWIAATSEAMARAGAAMRTALLLSSAFSLLILLPAHLKGARALTEPYARADTALRLAKSDIVLIDKTGIRYGSDFARNDPFMRERPIRLALDKLSDADLAALCTHYSLQLFDASSSAAFGVPLNEEEFTMAKTSRPPCATPFEIDMRKK